MKTTYRHRFLITIYFVAMSFLGSAQTLLPDGRIQLLGTIINGDTIPTVYLKGVEIVAPLSPEAAARQQAYLKLRRDVLRAYPYAKLASMKLKYINDQVATMSNERQKKRFIKETERELKEQFEQDLKHLTVTQGRILIKLIDRETGNTSYALVKELRGGLQAFFWQGLARLFGENLKSEYDAIGEDQMIEQIVRQIENGSLPVQTIN
ncbi:MAG: DUF4294 domain-containing protein [Bacteroidota bacterium]